MNTAVHIVPIGVNSWAVNVGSTTYQAFDSQEKAILFGQKMASKSSDCKIFFHDKEGNQSPLPTDADRER